MLVGHTLVGVIGIKSDMLCIYLTSSLISEDVAKLTSVVKLKFVVKKWSINTN